MTMVVLIFEIEPVPKIFESHHCLYVHLKQCMTVLCILSKNKQLFLKNWDQSFNYFPSINHTITFTSSLKRIKFKRDKSFDILKTLHSYVVLWKQIYLHRGHDGIA